MFTIDQFQTADDFKKGWKSLTNRTKSLERDLHTIALATLKRYNEDNDWGNIKLAMDNMRKSQRKDKLGMWFTAYGVGLEVDRTGAITIDKSKEGKAERARVRDSEAERNEIMERAAETPFWEFAAVKQETQEFNLDAKVKRLAKEALKAGIDPADLIAAMNAAVAEAGKK